MVIYPFNYKRKLPKDLREMSYIWKVLIKRSGAVKVVAQYIGDFISDRSRDLFLLRKRSLGETNIFRYKLSVVVDQCIAGPHSRERQIVVYSVLYFLLLSI